MTEKKKRGGAGKGQGRKFLSDPKMKKVHVVIYKPIIEIEKKGGMIEVKRRLIESFDNIPNILD